MKHLLMQKAVKMLFSPRGYIESDQRRSTLRGDLLQWNLSVFEWHTAKSLVCTGSIHTKIHWSSFIWPRCCAHTPRCSSLDLPFIWLIWIPPWETADELGELLNSPTRLLINFKNCTHCSFAVDLWASIILFSLRSGMHLAKAHNYSKHCMQTCIRGDFVLLSHFRYK